MVPSVAGRLAPVLLIALSPLAAWAEDDCEFYKRVLPRVYELRCRGGHGKSRAGEAYSSFADSFNINPASLPTEPSPYGLEAIGSYPSPDDPFPPVPTFAIIKGFHKIGTAVSTGGNNTFYGNDVGQRVFGTSDEVDVRNPETPKGYAFNLNLGTSIALGDSKGANPTLGLSFRYNKITNTIGWGTGLAVSLGKAALGIGLSRETVTNRLPTFTFVSAVAGYKFSLIEIEYTYLVAGGGSADDANLDPTLPTHLSLSPIHILTATAPMGRLILSGAIRRLDYLQIGQVTQIHGAAQFQLNSHLAIGYLINYVPGTHSVAAQIFL